MTAIFGRITCVELDHPLLTNSPRESAKLMQQHTSFLLLVNRPDYKGEFAKQWHQATGMTMQ